MENKQTEKRFVLAYSPETVVSSKKERIKYNEVGRSAVAVLFEDGQVKYGISLCGPADNFKRTLDRLTAEARCEAGFGLFFVTPDFIDNKVASYVKNKLDAETGELTEELRAAIEAKIIKNYCIELANSFIEKIEDNYSKYVKKVSEFNKLHPEVKAATDKLYETLVK